MVIAVEEHADMALFGEKDNSDRDSPSNAAPEDIHKLHESDAAKGRCEDDQDSDSAVHRDACLDA